MTDFYAVLQWALSSHQWRSKRNDLVSMECTLQGNWFGAILVITDFKQIVVSLCYQLQLEFSSQTQYDAL